MNDFFNVLFIIRQIRIHTPKYSNDNIGYVAGKENGKAGHLRHLELWPNIRCAYNQLISWTFHRPVSENAEHVFLFAVASTGEILEIRYHDFFQY